MGRRRPRFTRSSRTWAKRIEATRPPRILFPRLRQSHTEHYAQPARPIPVRILLPEHDHSETPGGRCYGANIMSEIEFKALTWIIGGIVLCVAVWRASKGSTGFDVQVGRNPKE